MKVKSFKNAGIALAILFSLSGCATIISGSKYPVSIKTEPAGADVVITNKFGKEVYKGVTPATVWLKSGAGYFSMANYNVTLNKPGFKEQLENIHFTFNGWYVGNVLIGGVIGLLIVDPVTGGMWTLPASERKIKTSLKPVEVTLNAPHLEIQDIKDITPDMKEKLVKVK
jgi:hypothetical protein